MQKLKSSDKQSSKFDGFIGELLEQAAVSAWRPQDEFISKLCFYSVNSLFSLPHKVRWYQKKKRKKKKKMKKEVATLWSHQKYKDLILKTHWRFSQSSKWSLATLATLKQKPVFETSVRFRKKHQTDINLLPRLPCSLGTTLLSLKFFALVMLWTITTGRSLIIFH